MFQNNEIIWCCADTRLQMLQLSTTEHSDPFGILLNQLVPKPNRSKRVSDFSDDTLNSGPITRAIFPHSQILLEVICPFIIQHLKKIND